MDHLLAPHGLFLQLPRSNPPVINLLSLGLQQCSKRLVVSVEISLFLKFESEFVIPLLIILYIIIPIPKQFSEPNELIRQYCKFVLMLIDDIFVVSEFHDVDLVLLALLLVALDFCVSVIDDFS